MAGDEGLFVCFCFAKCGNTSLRTGARVSTGDPDFMFESLRYKIKNQSKRTGFLFFYGRDSNIKSGSPGETRDTSPQTGVSMLCEAKANEKSLIPCQIKNQSKKDWFFVQILKL